MLQNRPKKKSVIDESNYQDFHETKMHLQANNHQNNIYLNYNNI